MGGIWIVAEKKEHALELLSIGRFLGNKMGTNLSVFSWRDQDACFDYIAHGADEVLLPTPPAADQSIDVLLPVIAGEAQMHHPDAIFFSATARCKDLAARLAARLSAGLCSNCIGLSYDEGAKNIIMERLAYGGAAIQKVACRIRPVMATIPPGTFARGDSDTGRKGQCRELPAPPTSALKIIELKKRTREIKDITEARVIVAAGRGFEKQEDLTLVRQLADRLEGEIGCTRPVSEENRWLPVELCIGLSGVQVKPDLYFGLGVSGQVQHVTGIRNARVIAAVNKDENAPIFSVADLGIVGDIYDVVPKLLQALNKG
jgi:electron transfer flavoprotein alpha subunit